RLDVRLPGRVLAGPLDALADGQAPRGPRGRRGSPGGPPPDDGEARDDAGADLLLDPEQLLLPEPLAGAGRPDPAGAAAGERPVTIRHPAKVSLSGGTLPVSHSAALMRRLFGCPGGPAPDTEDLLGQAASAHAGLLARACARGDLAAGPSLAALLEFLRGPAA